MNYLKLINHINQILSERQLPVIIALDGGSGGGKSTIASIIKDHWSTALVPLDDFFSSHIPESQWQKFTVEEKLENVFDWKRLRHQAIEPLLNKKTARWNAFDFESGIQPDGTYKMKNQFNQLEPADIILIEGAYSASPALRDLLDLTILVDVPVSVRHKRLENREERNFLRKWHQLWDEVEDYYFTKVRPAESFDIVITNEC